MKGRALMLRKIQPVGLLITVGLLIFIGSNMEAFIIVFIKLINTVQKKCWKSGSSRGRVVKASD